MKPLFLFLAFAAMALSIADEKYLFTRQPTSSTQVGEVVTVPPNGVLIADSNGKITKGRMLTPSDIAGVWGQGVIVNNFPQLQAAVADASVTRIILSGTVNITSPIQIPRRLTVSFNSYKFKEVGTQTLQIFGTVDAGRVQIFEGWEPGDITGTFNSHIVFPDWWGWVGTNQNDGQHDIAINCAAQSAFFGSNSVTVSLASGDYFCSRPLDLRSTYARIVGSGSANTRIFGTTTWNPGVWESSNWWDHWATKGRTTFSAVATANGGANISVTTQAGGTFELAVGQAVTISNASVAGYNGSATVISITNHNTVVLSSPYTSDSTGTITPVTLDSVMETTNNNCSSLVWLGSPEQNNNYAYFSGISGVTVNGSYVVGAHPTKRISCISWTGHMEELSIINDVVVSWFSGFGIGGLYAGGVNGINGLRVSGFWITGATRRGAIPIFGPPISSVFSVRDGTIDCTILRELTAWADTPPAYLATWPQFGILAAGQHIEISNVHVEGCGNAFHFYANASPSAFDIRNVDVNHGMDFKMRYVGDSANQHLGPPPALATREAEDNLNNWQPFIFHYSSVVSIGRLPNEFEAANNYNTHGSCTNIRSHGDCVMLLQDWVYGIDRTTYDGRFPNSAVHGITSYNRGIPYGVSTGTYPAKVPGAYYNKNSPATDKTYFTLVD